MVLALFCLIFFIAAIMSPELFKQGQKTIGTVKRLVIERIHPPFPAFKPTPIANQTRVVQMRDRLVDVYDHADRDSIKNSCLIIFNSQLQEAIDLAEEARTLKFLPAHLDKIEPLIEGLETGRWAEVAVKIQTFDNYLDDVTKHVVLPNALDLSDFKALDRGK
jgi:hypothetical protein